MEPLQALALAQGNRSGRSGQAARGETAAAVEPRLQTATALQPAAQAQGRLLRRVPLLQEVMLQLPAASGHAGG